jgi:hypothetical protein
MVALLRRMGLPGLSRTAENEMGMRKRFLGPSLPGVMGGVTFGDWLRLLWDNGFRVPPRYWPKAALTTLLSLPNSLLRWLESLTYGRKVAAVEVPPPLFILGHWRSGTTYLHRLLARDERFTHLTALEAWQPHSFLLAHGLRLRLARLLMPPTTRGTDNVAWDVEVPAEAEVALCRATFLSPIMSQVFPRRAAHYDRYLTFRCVGQQEVRRWQAAFVRLARKLTYKHRKPLVFKSPPFTGRIRLLLEVFPQARFIHIHRNPYAVYQSTRRLRLTLAKVFPFQTFDEALLHGRILTQYKEMYDAYFEERALIAPGRLCEVAFEYLEKDPLGELRRVYEELCLPDFAAARPALEKYVTSLAGYKKNEHPHLPDEVRADVAREWRHCFGEWHYGA